MCLALGIYIAVASKQVYLQSTVLALVVSVTSLRNGSAVLEWYLLKLSYIPVHAPGLGILQVAARASATLHLSLKNVDFS